MKKQAIILAAGKGTRMKSELPKVLHEVGGKPMLLHIIHKLQKIDIDDIFVIIGHKSEIIRNTIKENVTFVEQKEQKGTAHAVQQALSLLDKNGVTMVITGDTPLIEIDTLNSLMEKHLTSGSQGTVLTSSLENPTGYGRIILDTVSNQVLKIVEEKDTTIQQKAIKIVNTGIMCFDNATLIEAIPLISNNNSQGEYYLTDAIEVFNYMGNRFSYSHLDNFQEVLGINSRVQLAEAEQIMKNNINKKHMDNGVTIIDPNNTYIGEDVEIDNDTIIYPNVIIRGKSKIGKNCIVYSGTEIINSFIGNNTTIRQSVISNSSIANNVQVGPFAQIRPDTIIKDNAKVGNFVELKKTILGEGSKVNHLSYLGDTEVGKKVNIGCGTITVNYDGLNKHKTTIEDNAFIGCNSNLIAPVTIKKDSIVGAGSTITKDVPENSLAIARNKQENKENYAINLRTKYLNQKNQSN